MVLGVRDRVRELVSPLANHAYRRVWGARLLSEFGDWAARLALSLLVLERTGSAGLTGAIVGMTFLPWLGLGQYLATFGDRFDRRTVMVVADVARAATYVVIALIDGPIWIYFPLAFIASAFDAPFQSSRSAVLVNLTGEDEYPNALRLETITAQTGTVAGLLAGGGFSAVFGPQGALAANVITFLVSALILVGLPKDRDRNQKPAQHRCRPRRPEKRPACSPGALRRRSRDHSGHDDRELSYPCMRSRSPGSARGQSAGWPWPSPSERSSLRWRFGQMQTTSNSSNGVRLSALISGAVIAPAFALWMAGAAMLIAFFFTGVAFACTVPTNVVAGRRIPNEVRSSAFGFLQGAILVGFGLGSVGGGIVAERLGVQRALALCGVIILASATWAYFAAAEHGDSDRAAVSEL